MASSFDSTSFFGIDKLVAVQLQKGSAKSDKISSTKTEIGLPLYAISSMYNEPLPFLCQSAVLHRRKLAACFLSNLFYSQFGLLKYDCSIVLNLFHDMMT